MQTPYETLQQAYLRLLAAQRKNTETLIAELEQMNFQHAIDYALDHGDKEMFLTLIGGDLIE